MQRLDTVRVGLHLGGQVEHLDEFGRRQVVVAQEVPHVASASASVSIGNASSTSALGQDERRREPDDVRTDGVDEQPALARCGLDGAGLSLREHERTPQAGAALVIGERAVDRVECVGEVFSDALDVVEQAVAFDRVDHGERSRARHRIAAERAAVVTGCEEIARCADCRDTHRSGSPPPSPLASVTMSGRTPSAALANQ